MQGLSTGFESSSSGSSTSLSSSSSREDIQEVPSLVTPGVTDVGQLTDTKQCWDIAERVAAPSSRKTSTLGRSIARYQRVALVPAREVALSSSNNA
ncbi:hypothetical protein TIFTF001_033819 [Ficus carica]|uniref:Uncharacterized protein n=1 Tax=Ficus carica TaxID=3494 RepID=A0AA88DZH2_FICCA|nr:hypothetical protein TIFTF001_033819 [Ficus carica]